MDIVDMILPLQKPGHFIHGPKAVLHVLDKFNVEIIGMILNEELDKLKGLYNSNIGIIHYSTPASDVKTLIEETVNKRFYYSHERRKIYPCSIKHSYSAVWPAVVLIHEMRGFSKLDLTNLCLGISRARVHCSVILYPRGVETLETEFYGEMLDLLDKMKDYMHVVRHL